MGSRSLPPGFRFHPTHAELVAYYLKRKLTQKKLPAGVISELDIYKHAPWDLPGKSCLKSRDLKWYFFCPRERKYASGARMNRATKFGFWKSTGRDRSVVSNNAVVGKIKTLTFFRGKAPKGDQTDWVMHEYRIEEKSLPLKGVAQDAYVLCLIFQKDGPGPRNGAQYGAPFKEEEWDTDDLEEVDFLEVDPFAGKSVPSILPSSKKPQTSFAPETSATHSNIFGPSESCISENLPSTSEGIPQIACTPVEIPQIACTPAEIPQIACTPVEIPQIACTPVEIPQIAWTPMEIPQTIDDDELFSMQDIFPENGNSSLNDGDGDQAMQNEIHEPVAAWNNTDQYDIFKGLEDILDCPGLSGDGNACVTGHEAINSEQMLPSNEAMFSSGQMPFLELNDLEAPLTSTSEVEKYKGMQMSNLTAAYNRSTAIEQPCLPFISFGGPKQHVSSCHGSSLHNSNDQIWHPTDLVFPDAAYMSASSQSTCQENIHHNSKEGCSGSKGRCRDSSYKVQGISQSP